MTGSVVQEDIREDEEEVPKVTDKSFAKETTEKIKKKKKRTTTIASTTIETHTEPSTLLPRSTETIQPITTFEGDYETVDKHKVITVTIFLVFKLNIFKHFRFVFLPNCLQ